jgi:hypothetical protein
VPDNPRCRICGSLAVPMGTARILRKYDARFYSCTSCGFVQTESPFWLEEAYQEPFGRSDIGRVERNVDLTRVTSVLVSWLFNANSRFLDYGGGDGLFVRMMRDRGYDFYWRDKYAKNVFAAGFEGGDDWRYELVTAYEVFEHLPDPLETLSKLLTYSDHILFSTVVVPRPYPELGQWWYYSLDDGQHVSFYTAESLNVLAKRFGLGLCSNGSSLHLLSKRRRSNRLFKFLSQAKIAWALNGLIRRKSLLNQDYMQHTTRSKRSNGSQDQQPGDTPLKDNDERHL